jgi:MarR family transcriptional regulator, organic hydroperoxide resistance regulator
MGSDQLERFRNELSSATRAFKTAAVEQLRAVGVHAGQNFLLAELLAQQPLTTGELARRMHVEVPTAVRMTQRMEAAGLLHRRPDLGDRRRVQVSLTDAGQRAARQVPQLLDVVSEQALAGLSDAERETITDLLQRVSANLGWPAASTGGRAGDDE